MRAPPRTKRKGAKAVKKNPGMRVTAVDGKPARQACRAEGVRHPLLWHPQGQAHPPFDTRTGRNPQHPPGQHLPKGEGMNTPTRKAARKMARRRRPRRYDLVRCGGELGRDAEGKVVRLTGHCTHPHCPHPALPGQAVCMIHAGKAPHRGREKL